MKDTVMGSVRLWEDLKALMKTGMDLEKHPIWLPTVYGYVSTNSIALPDLWL